MEGMLVSTVLPAGWLVERMGTTEQRNDTEAYDDDMFVADIAVESSKRSTSASAVEVNYF